MCQWKVLGIVIIVFLFTALIVFSAAKVKAVKPNQKRLLEQAPAGHGTSDLQP